MRVFRLIAGAAGVGSATIVILAAQAPAATVSLDEMLDRASDYVERLTEAFVEVVAEERYDQRSQTPAMTTRFGNSAMTSPGHNERRELVSDFLLAKVEGADFLVPFRDVFQVDGRPVRDREDRLSSLFLHPTDATFAQAIRITEEGARYNIGNMQRTVNTPMLALTFLGPAIRPGFRYTLGREDPRVGPGVWIVDYTEEHHPTVVHGTDYKDMPASGRMWIEAATGRVRKTELIIRDEGLRAIITTSFRPDERFDVDVPAEMVEDYSLPDRSHVTGVATYDRFRRFNVTAAETTAANGGWVTDPTTGMALREIPAGQFAMGSPDSETGRGTDETIHDVALTAPFYLARFEVTEQEWNALMPSNTRLTPNCGPGCPVTDVTFGEVQQFLAKLNEGAGQPLRYRLPTEAEWEYACRAGTASPFSTGDILTTAQANYDGRRPYLSVVGIYRGHPVPVGSFDANPWGLADMHGNVWEWTDDWYAPYGDGAVRDPQGASTGAERVVRGGSWQTGAPSARCAFRSRQRPADHTPGLGFRVAADPINP
jgi:formylglycine-generating enzyme required for sulfatase activity